ncbi:hypothetical protein OJAV_G00139670 [Oryzias javanicus]|uniref:Uncharacterized protein n=1 Tax=Oryzias javanicus TaxID=123683 RepID=A0A3S2LY48_ORYJA|nr:hypothetical protein OJAV_G00139670 [Oryzias javanicus]
MLDTLLNRRVEGTETLRTKMSKIPAQNLAGTTRKKKEGKPCPTGNPQQSETKEVCSKVKQFLLEEELRLSKKRELLYVGRMIGELEILIKNKNEDLLKLSEKVKKKQSEVSLLQHVRDKVKTTTDEVTGESELDLTEAQILENEAHLRRQNRSLKEGLVKEIKMLQSENAATEELLNKHKKYRNLISRLCSRECQEAQGSDTRENEDDQNSEFEETAVCKKSPFLTWKNCVDSVRVMLKMEELEDQNLFLIESSTENKNDSLDRTAELISRATEEEERAQILKVNSMKNKCAIERRNFEIVKNKVDQHNLSTTVDQDILLETLRKKVTEVHSCFADAELSSSSTLEKLAVIENHMIMLLRNLEKIPKDEVKSLWQIKENEKRSSFHAGNQFFSPFLLFSKWREEKLRLETEKREEKLRRHAELAMTEPKKITGRKLMQRYMMPVVKPKTKVTVEVTQEPEDDLYKDLFSEST